MNKVILYLKKFDWVLFAAVILLVIFGLAEIYSVALGSGEVDLLNFKKQVFFVLLGLAIMFVLSILDYNNWRSLSSYLYIGGVILLVGVLFFGKTVRGTTAWCEIFGFSLQPVEFVKIIVIVFLARYFSSNSIRVSPLKHLIFSGIGVLLLVYLVLRQPDFGSALIIFLLWLAMLVLVGFKRKFISIIGVFLIISLIFGWLFFFQDSQKERIITYINPNHNSLDQGYNITQAVIAIGSGGFIGRGIGFGSQSQLKFLPESQNDFIFAVVSEELGFLGISLVFLFFVLLFYRLLRNINKINNDFGIFFLLGTTSLIFIEMFINIGMNIGILPVVGISLPFLSYGGSAIVSTLVLVGISENIIIKSKLKY